MSYALLWAGGFYPTGPIGTSYCGPANFYTTGGSPAIEAIGSDVATANSVTLRATGLPTSESGFLLNSETRGLVPFAGDSRRNLCLDSSIVRHVRSVANSGPGGAIELPADMPNLPQVPGPVAVLAGETWNFQVWLRSNDLTATSNFTDTGSISHQ